MKTVTTLWLGCCLFGLFLSGCASASPSDSGDLAPPTAEIAKESTKIQSEATYCASGHSGCVGASAGSRCMPSFGSKWAGICQVEGHDSDGAICSCSGVY